MLAIAGQTAGPNWLNFFKEPMGSPGVIDIFCLKLLIFKKCFFKFHGLELHNAKFRFGGNPFLH